MSRRLLSHGSLAQLAPALCLSVLFVLALCVLALCVPSAGAQDPFPDGPKRDTTPSDVAAIGFLRSYVDEQLYTLAAAGAKRLEGQATVLAEIAGKKMSFQYQVQMDYATNTPRITQIGNPPTDPVEAQWNEVIGSQVVSSIFSPRPSSTTADDVIKLVRDGELIRLDRRPRIRNDNTTSSEWYDGSGLPMRTVVRIPAIGDSPAIDMETTMELQELTPGKSAVVREVTRAPNRPEKVTTYVYTPVNGYFVLRMLRVETKGAVMVAQFEAKVEPAKATAEGKTP